MFIKEYMFGRGELPGKKIPLFTPRVNREEMRPLNGLPGQPALPFKLRGNVGDLPGKTPGQFAREQKEAEAAAKRRAEVARENEAKAAAAKFKKNRGFVKVSRYKKQDGSYTTAEETNRINLLKTKEDRNQGKINNYRRISRDYNSDPNDSESRSIFKQQQRKKINIEIYKLQNEIKTGREEMQEIYKGQGVRRKTVAQVGGRDGTSNQVFVSTGGGIPGYYGGFA